MPPTNHNGKGRRHAAGLREVASLAGVSIGTVSNVLNHRAKVSDKTAGKVHAAIEALGFVRNEAARQLRQGHSRSIGLIVLDVRNPFFTDVARGVEDHVHEHARTLLLANSAEDAARERVYLDLFEQHRVDGLLISPVAASLHQLDILRERGMKIILVDRFASSPDYSSVAVDDVLGGSLAATHLLAVGKSRIAFVGGTPDIEQVANRLAGARAALESAGVDAPRFFPSTAMNAATARGIGQEIAALPADVRPDGVFAANDLIALGLLSAFIAAGLSVPQDIALIGYDDIDYAASAAIPLSSIRQPAQQMGAKAAQLLLAEIEGATEEHQHVVFEPELVVRASTEWAHPPA